MTNNLVEVKNLKKYYQVQKGFVETLLARKIDFIKAVDKISFNIRKGEVFGLAGESGSGKTTTGRLVLGLTEPTEGKIFFDNIDISSLSPSEMRNFRKKMQIIFQDPYASLNPRMKTGDSIGHSLLIHKICNEAEKRELVLDIMTKVGLTPSKILCEKYPHQLSGGQRQRAVIARALILQPELIVADEPIAMADVSVRATLLKLMMDLKNDFNLTYLFITHDLATTKYICDRIAIMYLGKIFEMGTIYDVYSNPKHPYTIALLSAVPVPDPKARRKHLIPRGEIPSPINPPPGCRFHPRCPKVMDICSKEEPELIDFGNNHLVACHLKYH